MFFDVCIDKNVYDVHTRIHTYLLLSVCLSLPSTPSALVAQAGTGKTTVTSAYVGVLNRVIAEYTRRDHRHIVLVTTEKNSVINDVAEALFKEFSGTDEGRAMLDSTLSFGSWQMGPFTEKLSLDARIEAHPRVKPCADRVAKLELEVAQCAAPSLVNDFYNLNSAEKDLFRKFMANKSIRKEVEAAMARVQKQKCDVANLSGWVKSDRIKSDRSFLNSIYVYICILSHSLCVCFR